MLSFGLQDSNRVKWAYCIAVGCDGLINLRRESLIAFIDVEEQGIKMCVIVEM